MVFVEHFQRVQTLPFLASFIHAVGYVLLMSAFYQVADVRLKTRGMAAFGFTFIFVTLVSFSYISQTTFLPALTGGYHPDNDFAISMLYGKSAFLKLGSQDVGLRVSRSRHLARRADSPSHAARRLTAKLLVVNGLVSIAGALWTAVDLSWVLTTAGMVSYLVWNVLIVTISSLLIFIFIRRLRTRSSEERDSGSRHGHHPARSNG